MNVGLSAEVRYHWFREHLVVVGDWHRLSPSERDRLRHQPMPDEAAQSLRVDLSPWSCGMVFSELLGADLTRFGLCYLAPAEVPASDLTRLGRRLREEFPLLDSQVDSGAEGFELVVHGRPEESPALEVGPFGPGWKTTGASAAGRSVNWRACPGRSAPAIARISAWPPRQETAKPPC
nr:hypothetical protein [Pseudomonas aeruginosa]